MNKHLKKTMSIINDAVRSVRDEEFESLIDACETTLRQGNQVVVSGLGKNVPVCEKFVGSMVSLGMRANFMHTNSAVHGDLGMVHPGDLVIILTKSGTTVESVYLAELLALRDCQRWLLTFSRESELYKQIEHSVVPELSHEGDQWNVLPNNSTTINLILLQALAMILSERLTIRLEDFAPNHPGGAIGDALKDI